MSENPVLDAALAGRYRIEREIGRGGMATVYLADDLRHRRKVAVKVLRPDLAEATDAERFLREIAVAAQLSHPHIVPLYDSGSLNDTLFYVMPFVEGESLRRRMDREGQLPVEDVITITRQIASALEHAHARNVIHRDIKPENILLYEGEAMLADFGIALGVSAATDRRYTAAGIVLGTPEYMSPEQSLDESIDARSDQYSLGCVVYEMLAGELPYVGKTTHSIIAKRLTDPVPRIRRLRVAVPAALDDAVARTLSKVPADRFTSLTSFAAALDHMSAARPGTVAVLPFRNLSADPDNEFFADGITEDVIAHLSKIRALKVISRASVMPFKAREQSLQEIGAALGATCLLDCSVRRVGDRVRIVAQLIDAESDQHMWVETYDRQLTDIFAIQTDVALQIAAALEAELSPEEQMRVRAEPTTDLVAYQLFLQGRRWLADYTPSSLSRAIDYFERALTRDPDFALASANMCLAYTELAEQGVVEPEAAYRHAADAAAHALRADPQLDAAHMTSAYLKMVREFDWAGAERSYRRALELGPGSADTYDLYGRLCAALARYDEALALLERAQELDPLAHRLDIATTLLRAGRYDEAVKRAEEAMDLSPAHDRAYATLGWSYFLNGRVEEGLAELERAVSATPGNTLWLGQLGEAYAMAGNETKARAILAELETRAQRAFVSPYHFAYVHTGLGELDRAVDLLERAVAERTGPAYGIKSSFLFLPLHDHPRFRTLLGRMNLA
ncbi:MAG: protein kinase domain-containing protein [Gemmatimonadaceae bacterium]